MAELTDQGGGQYAIADGVWIRYTGPASPVGQSNAPAAGLVDQIMLADEDDESVNAWALGQFDLRDADEDDDQKPAEPGRKEIDAYFALLA